MKIGVFHFAVNEISRIFNELFLEIDVNKKITRRKTSVGKKPKGNRKKAFCNELDRKFQQTRINTREQRIKLNILIVLKNLQNHNP